MKESQLRLIIRETVKKVVDVEFMKKYERQKERDKKFLHKQFKYPVDKNIPKELLLKKWKEIMKKVSWTKDETRLMHIIEPLMKK